MLHIWYWITGLFIIVVMMNCAGVREKNALVEMREIEYALDSLSSDKERLTPLLKLGESSTLQEYLAYAALNNPGLHAAFNRWKAALQKIPQLRSLPDPRLNYAWFIREIETRVGPQKQKIGIAQKFPWPGKLKLQGEAALEAANALRQQYEAKKLGLFYQVKEIYYEYYYLGRAIAVLEENVRLMTFLEKVVRAKYRAGIVPHSNLIKAQVELDKLQDRLNSFVDMLAPMKARFNAILNRESQANLTLPTKLSKDTFKISEPKLLEWLKQNNPNLKAQQALLLKQQKNVELAQKNYWPDITLAMDYIATDNGLMKNLKDNGKDPFIAMISIHLPLWWDKNRAITQTAKARQRAVVYQQKEIENKLFARMEMVLYQLRDAERKVRLYQDVLLPRAKQALNIAQAAFETGKIDFLNLIDAQRTFLEFELVLERAFANRLQRVSELEMLTGKHIL